MALTRLSEINEATIIMDCESMTKRMAKGIIKKFGKEDALKFARSCISCPCDYLKKYCRRCFHAEREYRHYTVEHSGCYDAVLFGTFYSGDKFEVKQYIKELLNNGK